MNRELLAMVVRMAGESMFAKEPTIAVNNAEGAILMQLLFQVYAGTAVLNEFFVDILQLVIKRMGT